MQASSATRAGGEKDARLQYLSWRIWFMRRRHALVKEQQRGAEEEAVMTPTSYSEVRLGAGQREGGVWGRPCRGQDMCLREGHEALCCGLRLGAAASGCAADP